MSNLSKITVAILAGGLGTRLQSVITGKQKVVTEVSGRPFLQYILDQLNAVGFKNIVICTGYLGDQIKKRFGTKYQNLSLQYSHEQSPLGTGGALRLALPFLKSKQVLVMNGDSFCDVDLKKFQKFHTDKKSLASLVLSHISDTGRYGKVRIDRNGHVTGFEEKRQRSGPGWINAGVYLIAKSLLLKIPKNRPVSLETEIFPSWLGQNFYGYKYKGDFIDIGTPKSYAKAGRFFTKHQKGQKRFVLLDRDGTIIVERNYLSDPDQLELLPGAAKALRKLKKMGLGLLVITNQSGIGRGYFDLATLNKIHQKLHELLAEEEVALDGIYFCPHTPDDNCFCRKPQIALVEKARKKHKFDPKLSFVIGDKAVDLQLGQNIGATTILVRTGYGKQVEVEKTVAPDHIVDDLWEASSVIKDTLR